MPPSELTVGAMVRVMSHPPRYSAFDGWRGTVVEVHEHAVLVQLLGYPIHLAFGPSELQPVAVPTARVGAHFPGEA